MIIIQDQYIFLIKNCLNLYLQVYKYIYNMFNNTNHLSYKEQADLLNGINVDKNKIFNKITPEYLVNYDYLNRIMEDYGFILVPREDAQKMGFPEGSGMFIELYNLLVNEISRFPFKSNEYGKSINMTSREKEISFLNRYFIYKKIRNVNAEKKDQVT